MKKANLLRALYFLVFCCTASWLPVMADFCISKGLTGIQTSLVLSITPLMMFIIQPMYGLLADRFGYKKILLLSSASATIAYTAYLINGTFVWIIVVTMIMSVFYNTIQPVLDSLSLELVNEDPTFSYGTLRIAGAIGWAFTGIITGKVIDGMHISMIFIIAAMSMAGVFIFSMFLKVNRPIPSTSSSLFKGARELIENKSLLFLLISVVLISIGGTSIWNFYSLYMKGNGASASLVGYGLSLQGLCELPFFYFSARIIIRLGIKKTLVITVFALALRLCLYAMVNTPKWAIPIELLHGLSWSLFWVACVEYVNSLIDKKWMATGQSLLYAAYYGLGAIAGNYWTGFLADKHLPYGEIFFINGAIIFIVAILLVIFLRTNPQN
jgi:PPP family 3-phenylpropionic acid transporter